MGRTPMRSTKDEAEQIARVLRSLAAQRDRWRLDPDSQLSERERGLGPCAKCEQQQNPQTLET